MRFKALTRSFLTSMVILAALECSVRAQFIGAGSTHRAITCAAPGSPPWAWASTTAHRDRQFDQPRHHDPLE